jgi:isoleucyl-tRNA synthetase
LEGQQLEGQKYKHVFLDRVSPVVLGDHVTLEAGSGLVHTAPGHGADDYQVGLKYGLAVLAPVDAAGRFTDEAGAQWVGKKVFEANPEIIQVLVEKGALLNDPKSSFTHAYPVCWRCHNPIIFRATDQWFISMEKTGLRKACLDEIEKVEWIPAWGKDRIHGMLAARPDWCISRQRTWGVPIPVLYCDRCDTEIVDAAVMHKVADVMLGEGADAWYSHPPEDFLPQGFACKCGNTAFRKENDILDVWFDSGVSFAAVAEQEPTMGLPVDLYLEGSDQHRGWFHSSLMCSVGTRGHAPYRTVLTHGFVVDERGEKFSKSKGNAIPPEKLIAEHGAEIMRLWVSAADYANDVRSGNNILKMLSDSYRKIRNTLRYALGALDGFDPGQHAVLDRDLLPIDRWALQQLQQVSQKVLAAYGRYEFHLVYQTVLEFSGSTLSATYFDIIKDRLYTRKKDGPERRSAQTALYAIASDLMRLLAPVLSFTADEAWAHLPGQKPASVFLAGMPTPAATLDAALEADFVRLLEVRAQVLPALEALRKDKVIGKGEEARVTLDGPAELLAFLFGQQRIGLPTLFIVSQVERGAVAEKLVVRGERARGGQCPRCWKYYEALPVGGAVLCAPCEEALR